MNKRNRFEELGGVIRDFLSSPKIPNFIEFLEKGLDKELFYDPEKTKPEIPIEDLPVDYRLRESGFARKTYERLFPVSHLFRITHRYEREYLDNFMPLSTGKYIGRGSYKFVYALPWNQVVKVGKSKLPSDPIFGSYIQTRSKKFGSLSQIGRDSTDGIFGIQSLGKVVEGKYTI